jgi:transcription elongation factor GreA
MEDPVITPAGLERLTDELERLKTAGRREIADRLGRVAASETNRAESADFFSVREDQARLERRIVLLEQRLRSARLVEPDPANGRADVGERVRLRDLDTGERLEIELVGPLEADPVAGRVSVASPLGKTVLGLRRGEVATVDAPMGRLRFEILRVDAPAAARSSPGRRLRAG